MLESHFTQWAGSTDEEYVYLPNSLAARIIGLTDALYYDRGSTHSEHQSEDEATPRVD